MSKVLCLMVLCAVPAYALAHEKADKAAAASASTTIISTHVVPPDANGVTFVSAWITVLSTQINSADGKDLFIGFSTQTALVDTSSQGGSGTPFSATFTEENNEIQARVLVDGVAAEPGAVVYDALIRALRASLANAITSCQEVAESGPMAGVVTCTFGSDLLQQFLETVGVRNFNFIVRDVTRGNHLIEAQVRLIASNFVSPSPVNILPNNSSIAALIGPRTLTVEQVDLDPPK